ncbi:ligase-associated DNA damage response exonuclease [Flavihumibacter sp. RY-1]|uniref:Ligase-associated DNA damage response exonuclease n=1 Tax=Flavihumibacter fluminis TaxID=2909236 RepID=A0ABS9BFJ7_9BACT|nr:ligase-associated DNA damage response exonuclease [Flavihumibacter fluminis]MCF1714479.1 ligase-associated DNA damage response exonuclease [Flavihumibacter fluminis]
MLTFTPSGIYCPPGGFYIDPWKPVEKAVITHAHSDHARWGSNHYLCHPDTAPLLHLRLGPVDVQSLDWGEQLDINGVRVSLHPAGHIIGSSQVRVEHKGEVWVVSGDYKVVPDGISGPFEPVSCHHFITESTFGLPIYQWEDQEIIYQQIRQWVLDNQAAGYSSVLLAYSLGKAQRVISCLAPLQQPIYAHGAIANVQETLIQAGWNLTPVARVPVEPNRNQLKGSIVVAPPSADGSSWLKKFGPVKVAVCSGWMQVRGNARRRNVDAGFVLSDHADWNGLKTAVKATGASAVYVTHGFQAAFSRYLTEQGIEAQEIQTDYGTEEQE